MFRRLIPGLLRRLPAPLCALALIFGLVAVGPAPALAGGKARVSPRSAAKQQKKAPPLPTLARSRSQSARVQARGVSLSGKLERAKFQRVHAFGKSQHQRMTRHLDKALSSPRADRATAVAAVVRLMDRGYLRIGSERYSSRGESPSFGAATLRKSHVTVSGDEVTLRFTGKSGVPWKKTLKDPALAGALKLFMKLPGERLFQVPGPGGKMSRITATHVRDALQPFGIVPKDLRTYHANRIFNETLRKLPTPKTSAEVEKNIQEARAVSAFELRHRAGTSEKSYLDPRNSAMYRRRASQRLETSARHRRR